jgi:hypothetical protein
LLRQELLKMWPELAKTVAPIAATDAKVGPGRTVALHRRSSTPRHICEEIWCPSL